MHSPTPQQSQGHKPASLNDQRHNSNAGRVPGRQPAACPTPRRAARFEHRLPGAAPALRSHSRPAEAAAPRPPPCSPHRPCRLQDCESLDECVRLGEAIPAAAVTQALGAARPRAEPPAPRLRGPVGGARLLPRPQASWRRGSRSAASLSTCCTSPPSGRVPQNPTRPDVATPEAPRACEAAPRGWRKPAPRATAAGGVQSRDGGGGHCDAAGVGPNPANQTLLVRGPPDRETRSILL